MPETVVSAPETTKPPVDTPPFADEDAINQFLIVLARALARRHARDQLNPQAKGDPKPAAD